MSRRRNAALRREAEQAQAAAKARAVDTVRDLTRREKAALRNALVVAPRRRAR